jgi:hypothetical protein
LDSFWPQAFSYTCVSLSYNSVEAHSFEFSSFKHT